MSFPFNDELYEKARKIKNPFIKKAVIINKKIIPYESAILNLFNKFNKKLLKPNCDFESWGLKSWNNGNKRDIPNPSANPAIIVKKNDKYIPRPTSLSKAFKYL